MSKLKHLKILIAEDDSIILEQNFQTLSIFFEKVFKAKDGIEALNIYELESPDMLLLDIKMPKLNGLELVKKIRKTNYDIPIVVTSAYSDRDILIDALNLSIDGYLIKPTRLEELIDTLNKATNRNNSHKTNDIIVIDNNEFYDTATKELYLNNEKVDLGQKERALLEMFLNSNGSTISKEEILSVLYPLDEITDSAFKNLISRLRKKIGEEKIINIKGAGWKMLRD